MQYAVAALALAGAVAAAPRPQAVSSAIAPEETTPSGCSTSYDGEFMISVANVTSSPSKAKRQSDDKELTITLQDGVLTDDQGRTGYIASNNQFQFDGPVQAGAIYTAGFSACSNGSLALGNSAIFYQCLSGTFYNLYDESTGAQCSPIYINIIGGGSADTTAAASTTVAAAATQLTDGQIQATTATPVVSQLTDGQIQATTATAVVSQISDGQIQATTAPVVVSQISDGQIQASTAAAPVTQIADGQIQASTAAATTAAPVTQIADGQIQASTGTAVVSQISDGQIQAPTNGTGVATASPTVQAFTGAAALPTMRAELFGLAGAALAAVAML